MTFWKYFLPRQATTTFINQPNILSSMYKKRESRDVASSLSRKKRLIFPSKKAQVTIFIIIGLVLVLAVVLVIALKQELVTFKPGEIIPTQKGKVEQFITACIEQVGDDALAKVGAQGGYIDVPAQITQDANQYLRRSTFLVTPYWAYGPNTNIPSLDFIKQEIDRYMEQNIRGCLLNTDAFTEAYDIIEKSEIKANTEIVESKVLFNVHWNIEIRNKAGDVVTELIDHTGESPVKLKRIHTLASRIVEKEMETLKVEDITQDLLALEHPDVPTAGIEISCSKKEWNVNTVKQTILDLLRINIRELQIKGTDIIEYPEELTYYQNHYLWDIGEDYYDEDLSVVFNFDQNSPYTFGVTPLSGTKMKSSQLGGSDMLSFLCIQTWKFTYDVSFPVEVNIRDDTGYEFTTAFTAHVVQNTPYRGDIVSRPSYIVPSTTDEDYCKTMNIPMTVHTFELVQNELTGIYSKEPLDEVNTSFTCLRYKCEMGTTEYRADLGDVAAYTKNFPYCVGGILRGTKEGYKEDWERVVTEAGKETELELLPIFFFSANKTKIVKHQLGDEGEIGPAQELGSKESALIKIVLKKQTDLPNAPFHESTIVRTKLVEERAQEQNLELFAKADFMYELQVTVLEDEKFIAGYEGNWTVPWNAVVNAGHIIFHTVSKDTSSEEDMFAFMAGIEEHSSLVPAPEIK